MQILIKKSEFYTEFFHCLLHYYKVIKKVIMNPRIIPATIRKTIIYGIVIFFEVIPAKAQTDSLTNRSPFLYPEFRKSTIKLKTGETAAADMNYNTITQKMTFSQNGKLTDLNKPEAVDTIIIQDRKFIFHNHAFLEILVNSGISLYIQHKSELKSSGRPGAYGTTSHTLPPTSISTLYSENKGYDLTVPENFTAVPSSFYWVKINNKMRRIDSEHQFLKLFPKNGAEIKQFIDKNNINIKNQEDLIKLITYCNSLKG